MSACCVKKHLIKWQPSGLKNDANLNTKTCSSSNGHSRLAPSGNEGSSCNKSCSLHGYIPCLTTLRLLLLFFTFNSFVETKLALTICMIKTEKPKVDIYRNGRNSSVFCIQLVPLPPGGPKKSIISASIFVAKQLPT